MKKVSCVGYHATGSGTVDDFLREFDNTVTARSGIECRFLQDPDGIADLEFNLVTNPHRNNSGFALKRFLQYAEQEKRTFHHIFGKRWMDWARGYVEELAEFSYSGYWHADVRILPPEQLFFYKARKAINLVMPKPFKKNKYYNYLPWLKTYCVDLTQEKFLEITRKHCEKLCEILNPDHLEYVVLDQAVSPGNAELYLRYIDDLKVIVVDRDPRDVYLNDVIRNKDFVLPKDAREFCAVYRMSRRTVGQTGDTDCVLRVRFEDMIYRYDETTRKIMRFLELKEENHKWSRNYFDPQVSMKNTKLWEKYPEYAGAVKIIEEELPEYLYTYDR